MPRKIPRSRSIAGLLNLHLRKCREARSQRLHDRRARRRDQLRLQAGRIHRRILQQFHGRRSRHRKRSVRALHRPAAHIQRRTDDLIHAQRLGPNRRADDIHDRIHRADFVKMHGLDRSIVNLRLRRAQRLENRDRSLLRSFRDRSRRNDLANLRQSREHARGSRGTPAARARLPASSRQRWECVMRIVPCE